MKYALGYKDLKVYQYAYEMAIKVFTVTRSFPAEEKYSLTDQIRRSSRSICANIAEAYRKRRYPKYFISKISDADSETSETMVWLDFSKDFKYLDDPLYLEFIKKYIEIGKMLGGIVNNPDKFLLKNN
jgi:four helix bundle protein